MSYEIIEQLGQGSYGTVLLVRKKNNLYALKIINVTKNYSVERIYAEISILQYLKPRCREYFLCYDSYTFENYQAKVFTQFIPNSVTLDAYFSKNPRLPLMSLLFIANDLAQGLKILHTNQIVHRDIKPSNILFIPNNMISVKYIDYGNACMQEEAFVNAVLERKIKLPGTESKYEEDEELLRMQTECNSCERRLIGTMYYMAPEIYARKIYSFENLYPADIWSFGITLYEIVFGKVPWEAKNMLEMLDEINDFHEPIQPPKDASPNLVEIFMPLINLCCRKDPMKRITASELFSKIDSVIHVFTGKSSKKIRLQISKEIPLNKKTPYMLTNKKTMFRTVQLDRNYLNLDQLAELRQEYKATRLRKFQNPPPRPKGVSPWSKTKYGRN